MTSALQDLNQRFPIVDPKTGQATDYFMQLLRKQTGTLLTGLETTDEAVAALDEGKADNGAVGSSGLTMATNRLLGRDTAATGAIEELTLSEALDLVGSAAQGDILYRGASTWARLGAGTSGHFLKTLGPGANPAWAAASGGAALRGALVTKSVDQTTANYTSTTQITWDTETYDTESIHTVSSTVTMTIASPGVITWTGHNFVASEPIVFTTTGALPTGITAGTTYYVVSPAANTFQVSATVGGSTINTTGSQSGTHTATNTSRLTVPSGSSYARLTGQVRMSSINVDMYCFLYVFKNGAGTEYAGQAIQTIEIGNSAPSINVTSGWIPVVPGDHFSLALAVETDNSITVEAAMSWFAMEVIA